MNFWPVISDFVRKYPRKIAFGLFISISANILILLLPIYIAQSFDLLFNIRSHRAQILHFLPDQVLGDFPSYFGCFLGILLLRALFDFGQRYYISYLGELHLAHLRKRIFKDQLLVRQKVYDEKGIGKYLLRYSGDLTSIQAFFTKGIIRFISDLLLLSLTMLLLYQIEHRLALVVGLLILGLAFLTYFLNVKLYYVSLARRNAKSGLLKFVTARLQCMLTIKSFNRAVIESEKYQKRVGNLLKLGQNYHYIRSMIGAVIPSMLYAMIGAMMLIVFYLQKVGEKIDSGVFFAAILLMITILPVFRRCFQVSIVWRNGSISYQKLMNILLLPKETSAAGETTQIQRIELRDVTYQQGQTALDFPFYLDFQLGSISWIKGGSGSGKSTLLKVINGLYEINTGVMYLNGISSKQFCPYAVRKQMTVVSDEWKLLGKTVFEAISYSRKPSKRPHAQAMLETLELTEYLTLDTKIGELGAHLSTGQYKKLLYARAFLTRKPILLIDEPFKGLDEAATRLVADLLMERSQNSMIILFDSQISDRFLDIDQVIDLSPQTHLSTQPS